MSRFTLPDWVSRHSIPYAPQTDAGRNAIARIRSGLERFRPDDRAPQVSIVMPAYNEEADLLGTLSSLSELRTSRHMELIVVDNNSSDRTPEILEACGVHRIAESRQGITFARQRGLQEARGQVLCSADGDSIYPAEWAEAFAAALDNPATACVYGRYSFIPSPGNSRKTLGAYEVMAETLFSLRRKRKDYLNVMGFNSAFRRADALSFGGYNMQRARWQDGWMAMRLMDLGGIELVGGASARVWTSDRRLMADGSLSKALSNRVGNQLRRIPGYLGSRRSVEQRREKEIERMNSASNGDAS